MAPSREGSADDEDYFNDLSKQPSRQSGEDGSEQRRDSQEDGQVPKPKRMACVLCRKRKLRCDGGKPSCSTCTRLQHDCSYDEVRRKSGPKRGYVKALEARLAQVETLLKTQDDGSGNQAVQQGGKRQSSAATTTTTTANATQQPDSMVTDFPNMSMSDFDFMAQLEQAANPADISPGIAFPHSLGNAGEGVPVEESFPWEMIGLGLDEPLPNQDVVDELNSSFFDTIQRSLPMIHRPRYYAAMNLAPHMRPPVCLRYAMWANAASVMDKYEGLHEHFYQRARKYIQQDEMRGHGESIITVAHAQTWVLLATYEFKNMYFPRAWMSSGRATRLTLMMGMHRLDGAGLDVKQCLPPPKDWTEREERRRTFWMSFCVDRYSSIGTGWPMSIVEADIMTDLPVDEESFELSKPHKTMTLTEALDPSGLTSLSSYGGVVLLATLFGRNLTHLHRPGPDDRDHDLDGEFWKRHRHMDSILLNTALALPDKLRLPVGLNDPNIVFMNMNIHTSAICLHQAAIFKADRNRMPARISSESKVRCITAAAEIASIMRTISHCDLSSMNPFISFCLYVAARVFVQYLKSRPKDHQVKASLQFLLSAMHAIKRKNPLTESFLVQLDVDLESAGLEGSKALRSQIPTYNAQDKNQKPNCGHAAYGDNGLAVYNAPDGVGLIRTQPAGIGAMKKLFANGNPMPQSSGSGIFRFGSSARMDVPEDVVVADFELPVRTPHDSSRSGSHRSPQSQNNGGNDMDTSPDASGDHQSPNSSLYQNGSSRTSNTGYSPQNLQDPTIGTTSNVGGFHHPINGNMDSTTFLDPSFATDFDMSAFGASDNGQQQQSGFVLPADWTGGGAAGRSGFTPTASGMTPGNMGASMNEAEWERMMEDLTGSWTPSIVGGNQDAFNEFSTNPTGRRV